MKQIEWLTIILASFLAGFIGAVYFVNYFFYN